MTKKKRFVHGDEVEFSARVAQPPQRQAQSVLVVIAFDALPAFIAKIHELRLDRQCETPLLKARHDFLDIFRARGNSKRRVEL